MEGDSPYPSPSNSPYSTPTISPFVEKFPLSINTDASNQYGTIDDYDEEYDDDQIEEFGRKWSIFEKLERKSYWHFYSCDYFRGTTTTTNIIITTTTTTIIVITKTTSTTTTTTTITTTTTTTTTNVVINVITNIYTSFQL